MAEKEKYLFGPVPSRRLGLSLGVDIVPFKVCTLDCVYCQLGRTTEKNIERKDYVPVEDVLAELKEKLAGGVKTDFITISGSGEPTLNGKLGQIIKKIKKITDIPVAVLTNGTLLYRPDVRKDCALADVVLPSLDAGDEMTFRKINRPHSDISIEKLISGLMAFRKEYAGQIWLEVFFIEGINTSAGQIAGIREAIERIRPDKVQLNTAVRPTADAGIRKVESAKLQVIAGQLGNNAEVIADFSTAEPAGCVDVKAENVLSMLKRRPCSLNDICSGLGIRRDEALKYIRQFKERGVVDSEERDGMVFFRAN